jgi:hypothetical protein
MSADGNGILREEPTQVPTINRRQLTVEPGHPWPSAYRGSKYSIVSSRKFGDVAQWSHMGDLQAMTELPRGLQSAIASLGKTNGYGSFRLTASGEVLTKVPANQYQRVDQARANRGHIPVYVGQLNGDFDFKEFSNNPSPPNTAGDLSIWTGIPFRTHGEVWSVCTDDVLRWRWQDYEFESAFDHPELVTAYKSLRPEGGIIYINEHGHVWGNIDRDTVPSGERSRIRDAFKEWKRTASNAQQRLVTRRLNRTESEAAPNGLLPVYLGHISQFDGGIVPKPVVTDNSYFGDSAMDPDQ